MACPGRNAQTAFDARERPILYKFAHLVELDRGQARSAPPRDRSARCRDDRVFLFDFARTLSSVICAPARAGRREVPLTAASIDKTDFLIITRVGYDAHPGVSAGG